MSSQYSKTDQGILRMTVVIFDLKFTKMASNVVYLELLGKMKVSPNIECIFPKKKTGRANNRPGYCWKNFPICSQLGEAIDKRIRGSGTVVKDHVPNYAG